MMQKKVLVINPGSTSTKIAVFQGQELKFSQTIRHLDSELNSFKSVYEQYHFRTNEIKKFLTTNQLELTIFDAIIGRGGILEPIESGIYYVNQKMLDFLQTAQNGEHASNLGAIIAYNLAQEIGKPAFIADPVVVDEMWEIAKITGIKDIKRVSMFHALNQKSVARKIAQQLEKDVTKCNFVVAHLGGGISVGSHIHNRVVDVNNALYGDGCFSPERSGGAPLVQFYKYCLDNNLTLNDAQQLVGRNGGLFNHFQTRDCKALREKSGSSPEIKLVLEAMCYQIAKDILAHTTALKGQIDGIILTGGLTYDAQLVSWIKDYIAWVAPIFVVPGEDEMGALNSITQLALNQEIKIKHY